MTTDTDIDTLNARFGLGSELRFHRHESGLAFARVSHAQAQATLFLQGAQLTSWKPSHEPEPVIWLSKEAAFVHGKGARGGIPVCWPWFGPASAGTALPAHGFVRTLPWEVVHSERLPDGSVRIDCALQSDERSLALWPHAFSLRASFRIGTQLTVELTTENTGTADVTIGEALHTYFHISDISQVSVGGLEATNYIDKTAAAAHARQSGPVRFDGECDRIYVDAPSRCTIEDPGLNRTIHIEQSGAGAVVVWSPGVEKAQRLGDLGPVVNQTGGWRSMVCVETANALDQVVTIAPGERHCLSACYRVSRTA